MKHILEDVDFEEYMSLKNKFKDRIAKETEIIDGEHKARPYLTFFIGVMIAIVVFIIIVNTLARVSVSP